MPALLNPHVFARLLREPGKQKPKQKQDTLKKRILSLSFFPFEIT